MSQELGPVGREMRARIETALAPKALIVEDQSASHAGHSGARPEGETHFQVTVTSAAFDGQTRLARQRMVYEAVGDLMPSPIHALAIKTQLP